LTYFLTEVVLFIGVARIVDDKKEAAKAPSDSGSDLIEALEDPLVEELKNMFLKFI
jgi:hypothetical protein